MTTASKTSEKNISENQNIHFHCKWNPNSDSASLKAWEEENPEYATWDITDDQQEPSC